MAVRCVACEGLAATGGWVTLSDTPIYDQIRQELEAGGRAEPAIARRARAGDEDKSVSVWALVNQHRNGKRR